MTTTTSTLARAIADLGAVEVAPGRSAFKFTQSSHWWRVCNTANLPHIAALVADGHLPEGTSWRMPSWWTPEKREAWRVFNGKASALYGPWTEATLAKRFASEDELFAEVNASDGDYERITADLETGAEVPA